MDYFPKPTNFQPGIDVPLLTIIPMTARPPMEHDSPDQDDVSWTQHQTSWGETFFTPTATEPRVPNDVAAFDNWFDFPKRFGLFSRNESDELPVLALEQSIVRFATLLQSWAFFGLIELFCEKSIESSSDWSCRRTPGNISMKYVQWPKDFVSALLSRIKAPEWKEPMPPADYSSLSAAEQLKVHNEPGSSCCAPGSRLEAAAMLVLNVCYHIEQSEWALESPVAEIALSVRLLCETIHDSRSELGTLRSRFLGQQMRDRGWCPSVVSQTLASSPSGTLQAYYLYTMIPPGRGGEDDFAGRSEEPPVLEADASRVVEGEGHAARNRHEHVSCDDHVCRCSDTPVDLVAAGYRTRHTMSRCQCEFVGVETTALCDIIHRGKVPLIEMQEIRGKIHISLTEARSTDEFTAISHVWSQGLGNPLDNALPQCQLNDIWNRIERLPELRQSATWNEQDRPLKLTVVPRGQLELDLQRHQFIRPRSVWKKTRLLWMDTLCIPAGSKSEFLPAKIEAIARMIFVYSSAAQVMVLDRTLLDLHLANATSVELYAKIATMPWMHRSWTYQEGSIATYCGFECADSCVSARVFRSLSAPPPETYTFYNLSALLSVAGIPANLGPFWIRIFARFIPGFPKHNFRKPDPPDALTQILHERFYSSVLAVQRAPGLTSSTAGQERRKEYPAAIAKSDAFASTWNELARRSTTMEEDAYLIFANVLGYNTRQLTELPQEDRIRALLDSMDVVPVSLLFNTGPRLRNSWIPSAISRMPLTRVSEAPLRYKIQAYGNGGQYPKTWWRRQSRFPSLERMRFSGGSLWLQSEAAPEMLLIKMDRTLTGNGIVYLELTSNSWYKLEFDYKANLDESECDASKGTYLLLEPSRPFGYARGARLHPADKEYAGSEGDHGWAGLDSDCLLEAPLSCEPERLTAVYDCPLRYSAMRQLPDDAQATWIHCDTIRTVKYPEVAWRLEIKSEQFSKNKRLIARPEISREQDGWGDIHAKIVPIALITWLFFLVRAIVRLVIAVQTGWSNTTALYKASTMTWVCMMPPPVPEILLAAGWDQAHPSTSLDRVWVGCSLGLFTLIALLWGCIFYGAHNITYRAWVRSFDDDWPLSKKSWQYYYAFDFEQNFDKAYSAWRERWNWGKLLYLLSHPKGASKESKDRSLASRVAKSVSLTSDESCLSGDSTGP